MGRKIFRRTRHSFEVGLVVPSHPRGSGFGASINGAAGIRCCDLRCPESVGIIRLALADTEQEMITEFFPQIQDSTEHERTTRGHLIARMLHSRKCPAGGFADCTLSAYQPA